MALNPSNYTYQAPNYQSTAEQRLMAMQQQNPNLAQQYQMAYPYQQQMQPQYQQPMMQPQQQQYMNQQQPQNQSVSFECRPVTSIDEAKATPPRWDGSPTISVDSANKCIYEKKLNISDGTAIFNTYMLNSNKPIDTNQKDSNENVVIIDKIDYVEKREFDKLQNEVILLTQKHKKLYDELMGVDKNDESAITNANASR